MEYKRFQEDRAKAKWSKVSPWKEGILAVVVLNSCLNGAMGDPRVTLGSKGELLCDVLLLKFLIETCKRLLSTPMLGVSVLYLNFISLQSVINKDTQRLLVLRDLPASVTRPPNMQGWAVWDLNVRSNLVGRWKTIQEGSSK